MISFFSEDIKFNLLSKRGIKTWLKQVAQLESKNLQNINYVFCSDNYLLGLNIKYLDHNYLTDILTFPSNEEENDLEGDIFISIDRVKENSTLLNIPFNAELHRVLVHGLLHLAGYNDLTPNEKEFMTSKEDQYLQFINITSRVSRGTEQ